MEMTFIPLNKRIEGVRKQTKKLCEFHSDAQKRIDFVRFTPWLMNHPSASASCDTSHFIASQLKFHISNVDITEFIENVLGPYHLKFKVNWRLELSGNEEDPVYAFEDGKYKHWSDIVFKVKEGEFKVCNFIKKQTGFTEPKHSEPIYTLQMECE